MKRSVGPDHALRVLRRCVLALSVLLASPALLAQDNSMQGAEDEQPVQDSILILGGKKVSPEGAVFVNGFNMPLKRFLVSYKSKNTEERRAAYTFLLGVIDTTEGKEWCSYRKAKTISVLETIYMGLKKLEPSRYDERAAYVITGILKEHSPCKKER